MKKMLISVILALALLLAACGGGTPATPTAPAGAERPVIVMGTNAAFPPFEFVADYGQGRHGQFSGIDVAIGLRIAEHVGAELYIYDTEFASLIMEVQTGRIDFIAAAMTIRPDRAEQVHFSVPYFTATQYIVVPIDNTAVNSVRDLDGLIIGVQLGTTGDLFVSDYVNYGEVARYNRIMEAMMDLLGGSIDAVVVDSATAQLYVGRNADRVKIVRDPVNLAQEFYGIAVNLENTELLEQINEVISEMVANGEIEALFAYYSAYDFG